MTAQTSPFSHHGGTAAMVRLSLLNLAFNILTFSLWRFWGRTRVRRALWGGTAAWGDAVEYTGTGGELLLGFVVVMVAVFMPLAVAFGALQNMVEAGHAWAEAAILALQMLVVFLAAAGLYRARRYQLSRTRWRGIRAAQGGAAWRYGLMFLGGGLATIVTLGWAWPWAEMMLARYRLGNTSFGDARFHCDAAARPLYKRFAVLWLATAVFLAAIPLGVIMLTFANDHTTPLEMAASGGVFALLLAVWGAVTVALPYAWYRAAFYGELAAHTRFAGAEFGLEATTGGLVRLVLGNTAIAVLSLGVLRPWATQRTFRYACAHLRVRGEPDWQHVHQNRGAAPRLGEGLAAVFDGAGEF